MIKSRPLYPLYMMHKRDWIWLLLTWLVAMLLVDPWGEFPMNDDWGYAKVVKQLVETGEYQPGDWPVMTLFTQVLWASLLAKIFGFSFTVLRVSTLILAMLGSYLVLRQSFSLSRDAFWAWAAALTLLFNPLYFNLSFTFMTDVPFTVFVLFAVFVYRQALETNSGWYWLLATLLAAAATLIRQPAFLLAPAFAAALLWQKMSWTRLWWAVAGVAFTYGALLAYVHLLGLPGETPGTPDSLQPLLRRIRFSLLWDQFRTRGGLILSYVAVFLGPLLLLQIPALRRQLKSAWGKISLILATGSTVFLALSSWGGFPLGNIVSLYGLGPTTLYGPDNRYFNTDFLPHLLWPLLSLGAGVCLFLLLNTMFTSLGKLTMDRPNWSARQFWKIGLVCFSLSYGLYLLIELYRFDRYHLVLIPVLVLLMSRGSTAKYPIWSKVASALYILVLALFSIGGTADNFAWNRSRWAALEHLLSREGVTPQEIDGGPEFNGWYATAPQNPYAQEGKSWWFVAEDQYVLSFADSIDCSISSLAYPVGSWWPGADTLFVHKRPEIWKRDTISWDVERAGTDGAKISGEPDTLLFRGGELRSEARSHSGRYALLLTPEHPYAGKITLKPVQACESVTISAWRWGPDRSAGIVAAAPDAGVYHSFQNIFTEMRQSDGWHRVRHEIRLPADYPFDQLDIYLWDPVRDSVWMDDLQIIWRRNGPAPE